MVSSFEGGGVNHLTKVTCSDLVMTSKKTYHLAMNMVHPHRPTNQKRCFAHACRSSRTYYKATNHAKLCIGNKIHGT